MSIKAQIGLIGGQLHLHEIGAEVPEAIERMVDKMDLRLGEYRHRMMDHKGQPSVRTIPVSPLVGSILQ
jgi:ribosome-associated translation inhibitor RaiA